MLLSLGVKRGDPVAVYLPMVIELPVPAPHAHPAPRLVTRRHPGPPPPPPCPSLLAGSCVELVN